MHPRNTLRLWPTAALSLLAGCLIENPEPPPPPPPVELAVKGHLVDASGAAAAFVPVRLGGEGGPIVATDEAGDFVFADLPAGQHTVYAFDEFENRVGFATIEASADDGVTTVALEGCTELLTGGEPVPFEVSGLCFGSSVIDLPPFELAITLDALEAAGGTGFTNSSNTSVSRQDTGEVRDVFFSMHDGIARGGVREFAMKDHRLVGAEPGSDRFGEPIFSIQLRDRNGGQRYSVRDGSFRLEVGEGEEADRAYVLNGTNLVLDYGDVLDGYDPAYTLTVDSLRLEGTIDVDLPPPAPTGDITKEVSNPISFGHYEAGGSILRFTVIGEGATLVGFSLDVDQLPLPGTAEIELPLGDTPDLDTNLINMPSADGLSFWDFQLVSYTVSTEMTELPGCDEQVTLTLENLVFRFVGWDYDENSDRVDSFGEQSLTIDRIDVDFLVDELGGC